MTLRRRRAPGDRSTLDAGAGAAEIPDGVPTRQSLDRRLRVAVIAVSMLCAVLVLVIGGLLLYWREYLLRPNPGVFARGPFLTRLTETEAALRWTVEDGREVVLTAVGGSREVRARDGRFTGLEPDTLYAWTAAVDGSAASTGSFRTAPTDPDTPIRFVAFADYGSGDEHEWAVGRVAAAVRPAFAVTAGDNSYLTSNAAVLDRNIFKPLHDLMKVAPLWAGMGDHDLFWRNGADLISALDLPGDGLRYEVRYGPVQVVVLGDRADDATIAFAQEMLARPGPRVRFVTLHRPLQPGNPLLEVLREARVEAVFQGHLHRYERRLVDGVRLFTVGVGGKGPGNLEFTKASAGAERSLLDFGLLQVDVVGDRVAYTYLDETGRILDRAAS